MPAVSAQLSTVPRISEFFGIAAAVWARARNLEPLNRIALLG